MQEIEKLRQLVSAPGESLDVELKQWVNPVTPEGVAKIAKGCMALFNVNGGYLIFGFRDDGTPDAGNAPHDVQNAFHVDVIQGIVGKYASRPFPVRVDFIERNGQEHPVITVPSGVQAPVAAKADLPDPRGGRHLIRDNAVYVRSVSSNNTVSSSEARRGDWDRIVSVCFDNREADVGRFMRRHLAGLLHPSVFRELFTSREAEVLAQDAADQARELLDASFQRYRSLCKEHDVDVPDVGYREFAVKIDGEVPEHEATTSFLRRLDVATPSHSGWAPWVVLLGSADPSMSNSWPTPRTSSGA